MRRDATGRVHLYVNPIWPILKWGYKKCQRHYLMCSMRVHLSYLKIKAKHNTRSNIAQQILRQLIQRLWLLVLQHYHSDTEKPGYLEAVRVCTEVMFVADNTGLQSHCQLHVVPSTGRQVYIVF